MRRIERIHTYNLYLERAKRNESCKNLNKFGLETYISGSSLECLVSFNSICESEPEANIFEESYLSAFDDKDSDNRSSLSNAYNVYKFYQYLDPISMERFEIARKMNAYFKQIPEFFDFLDISASVKPL